MDQKRNTTVDFLRGFAMLLIILIHVTAYFRDTILARTLWEYSQVAVHTFVFCSAYLYFSKTKTEHFTIAYFWKRTKRLVIPYYCFLIFLFLYTFIFKGVPISFETIVRKTLFLNVSSRDLDWLVVLFLYFMILLPLIRLLSKKPLLLWSYTVISLISSIMLLFADSSIAFRLVMWLPWSLLLIVSYLVVVYEKKNWFFPSIIVISFGIFIISRALLMNAGDTLTLTENKYPPNIFYLSYGVFLMLFLYILHQKYGSAIGFFQKYFDFLSKYSYSIFFIHFLILYYFLDFTPYKKMQWWGLFIAVFCLTIIVQLGINKLRAITSSQH